MRSRLWNKTNRAYIQGSCFCDALSLKTCNDANDTITLFCTLFFNQGHKVVQFLACNGSHAHLELKKKFVRVSILLAKFQHADAVALVKCLKKFYHGEAGQSVLGKIPSQVSGHFANAEGNAGMET